MQQQERPHWRRPPRQRPRGRRIIRLVLWTMGIVVFLWITFSVAHANNQSTWEWLKTLFIPAVIALGGYLLNRAQSEREQQIASERAQDEALQGYLDGMPELLTAKEQPLHKVQPDDSLSIVARARTLILLSGLDNARKRSVLEFLYEAHLIDLEQTFIKLDQADLRGANLSGAHLTSTDLREADLSGADLREAVLSSANLYKADLREADLRGANLSGADLSGTELISANLSSANLRGAVLTLANLSKVDFSRLNWNTILWVLGQIGYVTGKGEGWQGSVASGVNLISANLRGADLSGANLKNVIGLSDELIAEAKTLEGATPPSFVYEDADWLKSKGRTEDGQNGGSL
jgi:uncharacterized protein YjbI with pentapeptide repeats